MKKVYVISVEEVGNSVQVHRHAIGFNLHELLGILEETQLDLLEKCRTGQRPDITREVTIITEKPKEEVK